MKNKMLPSADLANMIASLEKKSEMQKFDIEHSFAGIIEDLKPVNLIRNGLRRLFGRGKKIQGQIAEKIFNKTNALPSPRVIKISAR